MCKKRGPCAQDKRYCQELACLYHPDREFDLARMAGEAIIARPQRKEVRDDPPHLRCV